LRDEERNALRALTRGKRIETEAWKLERTLRKAGQSLAPRAASPRRPFRPRRRRLGQEPRR
jgi:hypothetical protein